MAKPSLRHRVHLLRTVGGYGAGSKNSASSAPRAVFETLELRDGVSYLHTPNDAPARFLEETEIATLHRESFVIEPVFIDQKPQAILINPPNRRARVNGQISPPAVLLRERDGVTIGDAEFLHVAIYRRPQIGPPPPEIVGTECPVCRTKIQAENRVYVCECGVGMHLELEDESHPESKPLQCAKLVSECPVCGRPVNLEEGYGWLPEEGGHE